MFQFALLTLSAVVILVSSLFGGVLKVPAQYSTIQAGIVAAKNSDTVLVSPGIYYENIKFLGKKIVVASRYIIDKNPNTIRGTVIDGSRPVHSDSASVVLFKSTEDSTSVLCGFTLINGVGTIMPGTFVGGGILVTGGSAPTIKYNIIRNNSAISGGGIAVRFGFPTIANNAIVANVANNGGGIWLENGQVIVTHNVIRQNVADANGGGVVVKAAALLFFNNSVTDNLATQGGGVYCDSGFWDIGFNNFFRNTGGNFVGCGSPGLGDNTRTKNFNLDSADDYQNIFIEPLYTNPAAHDYSLSCQSRLIDAGAAIPATYPLGGAREDIGMFEYPYRVGDLTGDGRVNVADATALINIIFLDTPIPCPIYSADADCDRMITIADVIAMINYWMGISQTSCLFIR